MDYSKSKNNFMQFEMWTDCNVHCKFCFCKHQPKVNKMDSIMLAIDKLTDPKYDKYNEVGFIGGEFFENQLDDFDVKIAFFSMFDAIAQRKCTTKIYLATALIFNMDNHLIPLLNHIKELGLLDKLLICTSYDNKYRFHTPEMEHLWRSNMIRLRKLYPTLKLHTEIIVTQSFINSVLNDTFNVREFAKLYDTTVDFIEPGSGFYYFDKQEASEDLPEFFPTKSSFIQFLVKASKTGQINLSKFLSPELRSNLLFTILNGNRGVQKNRRDDNYFYDDKHLQVRYERGFIDSDEKMTDVVKQFREVYGE